MAFTQEQAYRAINRLIPDLKTLNGTTDPFDKDILHDILSALKGTWETDPYKNAQEAAIDQVTQNLAEPFTVDNATKKMLHRAAFLLVALEDLTNG